MSMRGTERVQQWWSDVWFRPAGPLGLIAVRFIVALNALWIVLSRPDLPKLVGWPDPFFVRVDRLLATRYFFFRPPVLVEVVLWLALHVFLVMAMLGVAHRFSCIAAGVLLYHFAPFENILWHTMGPYFSGLTLPILALLILGFAQNARWSSQPSSEYRWPVMLIQVIFTFNYFSAAVSKVHSVGGLKWATAENIRGMALTSLTFETKPPLAQWVADRPLACLAIAMITMVTEICFIIVPFSRIAANILVPLAIVGHLGIVFVLGIVFLNLPCLLIYLDWDELERRLRNRYASRSRSGALSTSTQPSAQ